MNAPIKEDIWIEQPEGHEIPGMEGYVYKLDQALYGCKQSSHCFQQFLKRMLAEVGATPLVYDDSIYQVRNSKGGWVLIGTHVDDLFALANEEGKIIRQQIFDKMSEEVTITNDGEISWALKASIDRDPESGILKITNRPTFEKFWLDFLWTPSLAKTHRPSLTETCRLLRPARSLWTRWKSPACMPSTPFLRQLDVYGGPQPFLGRTLHQQLMLCHAASLARPRNCGFRYCEFSST